MMPVFHKILQVNCILVNVLSTCMGSKMRLNVRAIESVENDGSVKQLLCEANLPQQHYNLKEVKSIRWC